MKPNTASSGSVVIRQLCSSHALVQANKSAVIEGKEGHYPPVTAQDFVRESLEAIYLNQESKAQEGDNDGIAKAAKHPETAVLNAVD